VNDRVKNRAEKDHTIRKSTITDMFMEIMAQTHTDEDTLPRTCPHCKVQIEGFGLNPKLPV